MALAAIGERRAGPSRPRPIKTKPKGKSSLKDNDIPVVQDQAEVEYSDSDPEVALAIQTSLDQTRSDSGSRTPLSPGVAKRNLDDDGEIYASPTHLETALAIAGAGPSSRISSSTFGKPTLLTGNHSGSTSPVVRNISSSPSVRLQMRVMSPPQSPSSVPIALLSPGTRLVRERGHLGRDAAMSAASSDDDMDEICLKNISTVSSKNTSSSPEVIRPWLQPKPHVDPRPVQNNSQLEVQMMIDCQTATSQSIDVNNHTTLRSRSGSSSRQQDASPAKDDKSIPTTADRRETSTPLHLQSGNRSMPPVPRPHEADPESEGEGGAISDWSRSPSPAVGLSHNDNLALRDTLDAAQEMDIHTEEGEFARFVSQVKGRDLDDVRAEIDQEIKSLHHQKKAAMRDSDDITQQMISQIMVCQFVIPVEK